LICCKDIKYLHINKKRRVKLPKCRETHVLIHLFIGVSAKVIEHITDDAYNRQGEFRGKKAENQLEKRGKSKATPTNGR
jgi:hypothetical protein